MNTVGSTIVDGLYLREMNDLITNDLKNLISNFIGNFFEEDWVLRNDCSKNKKSWICWFCESRMYSTNAYLKKRNHRILI